MDDKTLSKLNTELQAHFGATPAGGPLFKWCLASELFYLYEREGYGEDRTDSGLYVARKRWDRHSHAEHYGNVWMLTAWAPPEWDRMTWWNNFAGAFPYPVNGEYHPIESTVLPVGEEPSEALNLYTVRKLYGHLGMDYKDHLDNANSIVEKHKKADASIISDAVDDMVPAFGNVPGEKSHVSFPTVN